MACPSAVDLIGGRLRQHDGRFSEAGAGRRGRRAGGGAGSAGRWVGAGYRRPGTGCRVHPRWRRWCCRGQGAVGKPAHGPPSGLPGWRRRGLRRGPGCGSRTVSGLASVASGLARCSAFRRRLSSVGGAGRYGCWKGRARPMAGLDGPAPPYHRSFNQRYGSRADQECGRCRAGDGGCRSRSGGWCGCAVR